jgi:hypothetical protein
MPETNVDCSNLAREVQMVYSVPRVTWTANARCAVRIASTLGIDMVEHTSAFWSKSLETALVQTIEAGRYEFALVVDYDSVFSPENVLHLYALAKANQSMDAIAAMQIKRDGEEVLLARRDEKGEFPKTLSSSELNNEMFQAEQAHFGLTLIRLSALRDVPRPWFLRIPDPEKESPETLDDDIYFWRLWKKHNKTLYVDCHNGIGHVQEVVTWPGTDLRPVHQLWGEFKRTGRPKNVRSIDQQVHPARTDTPIVVTRAAAFGDRLMAAQVTAILNDHGITAEFMANDIANLVDVPLFKGGKCRQWNFDYPPYNLYDGRGFIRKALDSFQETYGVPRMEITHRTPPVRYIELPEIQGTDVAICSKSGPWSPYRNYPRMDEIQAELTKRSIRFVDLNESNIVGMQALNWCAKSKLYLGLDTGMSHYVAGHVRKGLILQSGFTPRELWASTYDRFEFLEAKSKCELSPCFLRNDCPRGHKCMNIDPIEIADEIERRLA